MVGIACRLPGARDHREFFASLCRGESSIREITPDRWDPDEYYSSDFAARGKSVSKWCGMIDDPFAFDHAFFQISRREAKLMDPQQRLLLEESWRCIEDAGIPLDDLRRRRASVYFGVMARDHLQRVSSSGASVDSHSALGGYDCILANRVSHTLGLRGASVALDAACASSLVAICNGIDALQSGDADYVLAGGVSLDFYPWKYQSFSKARMLSPDGQCKTFDKRANGYVPGEGVAVVLLRRLDEAIAEGDHIYGVLAGGAVNHGGRRLTITAPTVESQSEVITMAMERAGFEPQSITYVEAHGTGTALGDPVEVEALRRVFAQDAEREQWCWLGSVKPNIGHLEAAAGITGLFKVLLMMHARRIPPNINLQEPNPLIDFAASPFRLVREVVDWAPAAPGMPLRAGISSFGMGGVNSHLVVEEHREPHGRGEEARSDAGGGRYPFLLSARTEEALEQLIGRWRGASGPGGWVEATAADISWTLATGREHFPFRAGGLVGDLEEIEAFLPAPVLHDVTGGSRWWLRVGELTPPAGPRLEELLARQPFAEIARDMAQVAPAVARQMDELRAGDRGERSRCLFGYLLVRVVLHFGFRPEAITALDGGLWAALAATGALDLDVALDLAAGEDAQLDFGPPTIPFIDPFTGHTAHPYRIDESYFDALLEGIQLSRDEVAGVFAKAGELLESQFTFRSNVNEWNRLLGTRGRERWQIPLEGAMPHTSAEPIGDLIRVLAVQNALDRLVRKWNLPQQRLVTDARVTELLDLLLDGVISPGNALALLDGDAEERRAAACDARRNARQVAPDRAYQLMRSRPGSLAQIGGLDRWRERARPGAGYATPPDEISLLTLADSAGALADERHLTLGAEALAKEHLAGLLLQLWLRGVDIEWRGFFAGDARRRVSLPTYAFLRTQHLPPPMRHTSQRGEDGAAKSPEAKIPPVEAHQEPDEKAAFSPQRIELEARWVRRSISKPGGPGGLGGRADEASGTVLVFASSRTQESVRGAALEEFEPAEVLWIQPGSEYRMERPGSWTLRPGDERDVHRFFEALGERGELPRRIVHLAPPLETTGADPAQRVASLNEGFEAFFLLLKALLACRPTGPTLILDVASHEGHGGSARRAAVTSLAKCIRWESTQVRLRSMSVDSMSGERTWSLIGRESRIASHEEAVRYVGAERYVEDYRELDTQGDARLASAGAPAGEVAPRGVYLIAGGAGGLGRVVAKRLLRLPDVRVALVGRAPVSQAAVRGLLDLEAEEASRAVYFAADISRPDTTRDLARDIRTRMGPIRGVIQAAGVLRDGFLMHKSLDDIRAVLAPKIAGTLHLDWATRNEPLDVFVLFSSLVAVTGNVGQTGYALANGFLDGFATERERLQEEGERLGRTLVIDWPLWAEGGMHVREGADSIFTAAHGLAPMPAAVGLEAFDTALEGAAGRRTFVYGHPGDVSRLIRSGGEARSEARASGTSEAAPVSAAETSTHAVSYLRAVISNLLEVPESEIDLGIGIEHYGMDSILISQFNTQIENDLGAVSHTLLFECRTLAQAAAQIAEQHGEALAHFYEDEGDASREQVGVAAPEQSIARPTPGRTVRRTEPPAQPGTDVAVIGLAGRYPMAPDLQSFWRNLEQGRDCIAEIPRERWDYREYYTDDAEAALEGAMYCKWGGFLADADRFDPLFFNISPREAELMDPQERIFLETAWETFEHAGYPPYRLGDPTTPGGRSVGVFVGVTTLSYLLWGADHWREGNMVIPTSLPWSISNRVSYWLDLQGPSLSVDTACASSLSAVHLACESLNRGECRSALVGAVNLYLHPSKYSWLCQMQMLSRRGRCHAFGSRADGFVPGEGVGAMLLKPLSSAVADGDRILGVIKGTATNHGGRTNGFTVPSPNAQAELIRAALRKARVAPSTIGYIEAHGTGTALGDPIEIAGITKALGRAGDGDRRPIGSVKSNIGHLESAAGMASVTKVLLQMHHRKLVPSLHADPVNPRLDLAAAPVEIQQTLADWPRLGVVEDGHRREVPRRAGISSFGAGGANAHVIIEEYDGPRAGRRGARGGEHLVVLSAKNRERLREHCRRLAEDLRHREDDVRLSEISYQLQVRREPLADRAAIIAADLQELIEHLDAIAAGRASASRCWLSERGAKRDHAAVQAAIDEAMAGRDLETLALSWASGGKVDWAGLHDEPLVHVDLPTYPFADERYWVPAPAGSTSNAAQSAAAKDASHPFLGAGTHGSDSSTFSVELTGEEFFLADHRVEDQKVFPAVGYLEMARAAAAASGLEVKRIRNNVWSAALAVSSPRRVHIELIRGAGGADYTVYSLTSEGDRAIHGEGKLDLEAAKDEGLETLDLQAIRTRCPERLSGSELYPWLHDLGLRLGSSYQGIESLRFGDGEALSEIRLPASLRASAAPFVLHPSVFDSALQASLWLLGRRERVQRLHIPFSIGSVELYGETPTHCFSHVLLRSWSDNAKKIEVRVVDPHGRILLRARDFWLRPWAQASPGQPAEPRLSGVFFRPVWEPVQEAAQPAARQQPSGPLVFAHSLEACRSIAAALERHRATEPCVWVTAGETFRSLGSLHYELRPNSLADYASLLSAVGDSPRGRDVVFAWPRSAFSGVFVDAQSHLADGVEPLLGLVQALLRSEGKTPVRLLCVYPGDGDAGHPVYEALGGFLRTASRESLRFMHRLLELPADELGALSRGDRGAAERVVAELTTTWSESVELCHRRGQRLVKHWLESSPPLDSAGAPLRRGGVYLITGGAGGLGAIVARYLASEWAARLVLTGRTPANGHIESILAELRAAGGDALYVPADISHIAEIAEVVAAAKSVYGALHGVFHCAGVLRDGFLIGKQLADLRDVVAPKLQGTLLLDAETRREPLDLFVLFSSIAGITGNVGQAGYAFANSFLDAFAGWRDTRRAAGQRSGKTLSMAWPLWRDGGMKVDAAVEESLRTEMGLRALETANGLAALEVMLKGPPGPVLFVPGDGKSVAARLGAVPRAAAAQAVQAPLAAPAAVPAAVGIARKSILEVVTREVAETVKLDVTKIDPDAEIGNYGFDSIAFTRLANRLNKALSVEMTPATFFEYTTAGALTDHLIEAFPDQLAAYAAQGQETSASTPDDTARADTPDTGPDTGEERARDVEPTDRGARKMAVEGPAADLRSEPIAIIGMHGLMPGSEDLDEYWRHLDAGDDLVVEIPADRWDWREYYGDPQAEPNTTNSKWGGFLNQIDTFDARFFGISPREAQLMDPQQRLFLQTVYRAIEEAGYSPSALATKKTGLFVGVATHDYYDLLRQAGVPIEAYTTTGLFHALIANRASYLLNLKGPSFPIDTACSSSLVAVRSAIEAIRSGSCEVAIAGGVNLLISPMIYISFARAGMLSPDGRCKTFDQGANGYVRGEGVGALVLKPFSKALRDGDHIHALIRGSAVNHGGRVNTLTTPNPNAQAELIKSAFEESNIDPETIGYMELHGTGTALGDPIEVNGLRKAFREIRRDRGESRMTEPRILIGSVKSNIGHLEAAAGMAGIFKVLLAMKHGRVPGNLHIKELNPHVQLSGSPFRIAMTSEDWPRFRDEMGRELPRRAGVSSFGFGGVNAHVLLEEHMEPERPAAADRREHVIVLSARTDERLRESARQLAHALTRRESVSPGTERELRSHYQIEAVLRAAAAEILGVPPDEVPTDEALRDLGLDAPRLSRLWDHVHTTLELGTGFRRLDAGDCLADVAAEIGSSQPEMEGATLAPGPLGDLAYTLQVGREAMTYRLAVVVSSTAALAGELATFAESGALSTDMFHGTGDDDREPRGQSEAIEDLVARRDLRRLAEQWAQGQAVPWEQLHHGTQPRRLSLPTYPFAQTRYWIPATSSNVDEPNRTPLQRFDTLAGGKSRGDGASTRTRLSPSDTIVGEHRIHGQPVFPGVGYLDIAYAALAKHKSGRVRLTRVSWLKKLVVEAPGQELNLHLRGDHRAGELELQDSALTTYCRGAWDVQETAGSPPPAASLEEVMRRCPHLLSSEAIYERFRALGIDYGPSFRGLRQVHVGEREALARVSSEGSSLAASPLSALHPTIMDAALQAITVIDFADPAASMRARLPFALEAVEVYRQPSTTGYVHVHSQDGRDFDVAVLDDAGRPCVILREVSVREEKDTLEGFFFVPTWVAQAAPREVAPPAPSGGGCLIVHTASGFGLEVDIAARYPEGSCWRVCVGRENRRLGNRAWEIDPARPTALASYLREIGNFRDVYVLADRHGPAEAVLDLSSALAGGGALTLFRLIKALADANRIQSVTTVRVAFNDIHHADGRRPGNLFAAGITGFAKSLAKEFPRIAVSCVDLGCPSGAPLEVRERARLVDALLAEPAHRAGEEVMLLAEQRLVKQLRPAHLAASGRAVFRTGGVYLIIGGTSGIGLTLAHHLSRKVGARLMLVGRRAETPQIVRELEALRSEGGEALYRSADVTDPAAMQRLVEETKTRFGALHGVIHGAMVLHDSIIERMHEDAFRSVLAPKVTGSQVLGRVLGHEPLDFLLLLSSVQSFTGSAGQSNYAVASTFQDAFAAVLASSVSYPVKVINWGFWGTVGSVATEEYRRRLAARGFHSISTQEGMEAIERVLAGDARQVVAIRAEPQVLASIGVRAAPAPPRALSAGRDEPLHLTDVDRAQAAALDRFIALRVLATIQRIGSLRRGGERHHRDEFAGELGALPKYARLIRGLIGILTQYGFLREDGDDIVATAAIDEIALKNELRHLDGRAAELGQDYPSLVARLRLVNTCVAALPQVIRGEQSSTEVIFPGSSMDLVAAIYRGEKLVDYCNQSISRRIRQWIDAQSRDSEVRILEIGGGTGGTTHGVLKALAGTDRRVVYDFTDVSVGFLRSAQQSLDRSTAELCFNTLNIERPVEHQGFAPHACDVVLAANVLHAVRDLDTALGHVRRLLKPGGLLVLTEVTRVQPFHTVTFGLLDGWWHYQDPHRRLESSPLLDVEMWRRRLERAGFDHVRAVGHATGPDELPQRVILAVSEAAGPADTAREVVVAKDEIRQIAPAPQPRAAVPGAELVQHLKSTISTVAAKSLGMPVEELDPRVPLSTFGVDSIVGVEMINLLNQTLGLVLKTIVIFDYPTVEDMARFIANTHGEELSDRLAEPENEHPTTNAAPAAAPQPAEEHRRSTSAPAPASHRDSKPAQESHREWRPATVAPLSTSDVRAPLERFRAVRFERPGSPSQLRVVDIEPVAPRAGEVEILVHAFPINFSDFLLAKGLYPLMPDFPFTPGVEVSGVVRRVGPDVERLSVGDEVIALMRPEMGGQASVVVTDESFVVRKPANISHEEACGFPVAFLAMYLALERAAVVAGDRVLIPSATGTLGLMAVQLAKLSGARVLATAGTQRKVDFLSSLGVDDAINYRDVELVEEVRRRTGGEGVDVVIDTVGGDVMQQCLSVVAPEGRYVEIAVFGLQASGGVDLSRFVENQTFYSFNTKKFFLQHPEKRVIYLEKMASYLESGRVEPLVYQTFPFEHVHQAYRVKEDRDIIGRVVVSLSPHANRAATREAEVARLEMASRQSSVPPAKGMEIAVVGMSARFPGADDVDELWDNLRHGVSSTREVPASRWANERFFDPDPSRLDATYCKFGAFLDDIDRFDASFFDFSGKEAAQTDPQQRLFLEEAYKALESAGYPRDAIEGQRCGVFVGVGPSEYLTRMNKAGALKHAQAFWGNEASVLTARIAYFLNLKGPSVAINTACSSSLVALHLACQSLLSGESHIALAGGVFLALAPDYFVVASNGNMLSPEGKCKTFDDGANGFGPGEGVGVLVLKPLARALEDGDHIYGVIQGSAINQDGKTNGITAPSSLSQTEVELAAYERAGIDAGTIGYVEAHGTGTKLGDPIEIEALTNSFRKYTDRKQFCPIGSIKTNIGHTAAAAGIAGIIKILLAFRHRQIPASLNYQSPNRYIDFENSPFFVNTEAREWIPEPGELRRAVVSSFGFSGTNAHVVLEEGPPITWEPPAQRSVVAVPLSAKSVTALQRRIDDLARWLVGAGSSVSLPEIAYNLQIHRNHYGKRAMFLARDRDDLLRQLISSRVGEKFDPVSVARDNELAELVDRYLAGEQIDWRALWGGERCRRLLMPTYPFDDERHWYTRHDSVYSALPVDVAGRGDSNHLGRGGNGHAGSAAAGHEPTALRALSVEQHEPGIVPPVAARYTELEALLRDLETGKIDENEAEAAMEVFLAGPE